MYGISSSRSQRGSVLIYALLLAFFGTIGAYLLFVKSEVLTTSNKNESISYKSDKNIESRAELAIKYSKFLNTNGNGFNDTLTCPYDVSLYNVSSGSIVFTESTSPKYGVNGLYCIATNSTYGDILVNYNTTDYSSFESVDFYGSGYTLSTNGATQETSVFVFSEQLNYQIRFTTPLEMSGIDADGDSDDYRSTSTGNIAYPDGHVDNDALGRQVQYGYVRREAGYTSVLWSNKKVSDYIDQNPNNFDGNGVPIGATESGALYLIVDRPFKIKIVTYDRARYIEKGELYTSDTPDAILEYTYMTGAQGYVQNDLTLSGAYGETGPSLDSAKYFDFKNKDYAVFIGSNDDLNNTATGPDFLRYQVMASTSTGANIYITPIHDHANNEISYLGNDIIINGSGDFVAKEGMVVRADDTPRTLDVSSLSEFCKFDVSFFGCNFY